MANLVPKVDNTGSLGTSAKKWSNVHSTTLTVAAQATALSLNSQKITNLATPTADTDAATKAYVDNIAQGLSAKDSVRVATTANGTLASAYANGQAIDGVTLATGDRVLIKNQTAGAENGVYTVNASGAPTRAVDFDANAEVAKGAFVFVEEGTVNADSGFVLTTDGAITLGTTALTFTQFSGAGQITAGDGLGKTGNTLNVDATVITGQTAETANNDADLVLVYDDSASALRKMTRANFLSGVGGGGSTTLSGLTDSDISGASAGHILIYDGTNSWDNKPLSGDATISSEGALTIAANAVEGSMLNNNIVSGLTDIGGALATTDEIIVSDAGTIKRTALSRLSTMIAGSGISDNSGTLNLNIDGLTALGGTGLHQTEDHFAFSDNGTEKKITFSNLEDAIFDNVTGDATIAAGGALTISANAVEGSMLNTNVVSGQTEMTGDVADTDELLISDAGTIKRADFSVLRDAVFNDISGDATVAAGGALTIAATSVENSMLAGSIANNKLANSAVTITAGDGLTGGGSTALGATTSLALDLNELTAATVDVANDSIAIIDANDSNASRKETIADLASGMAGTGIDASSGQFAIDSTVATLAGSQTLTNKTLTSPVLNTGVSGTAILDEDDMNSNSATQLATQQSIKAYVDAQVAGGGLNIDGYSALGGTGIHQTQDHFVFSDNGTEKKITFSNLEDAIFANISGDATVAAGGELTIGSQKVTSGMLAAGAINVVTDTTPQLGGALDVNGKDIVSVSNGNITLTPDGSGVVRIDGTSGIDIESGSISIKNSGSVSNVKLYCEVGNAHYTQLQSAAHGSYSGNVTLTLPTSTGNLVGTGDSGTVTNTMLAGSITAAKMNNAIFADLETLGAPASDGQFIVATGSGAFAYESANTARTSLGLGTGDSPTFTSLSLSGQAAALAMNSQKITGLGTPTSDGDAATKAYVDSVAEGLDVKDSVHVASTANIATLSDGCDAGATIDGVTLVVGDRVLLKDQSTASQNGIYVVAADGVAPSRAADMAASSSAAGVFVFVEEGTANADAGFVCTSNAGADTVGTHSLTFTQFSGAGQITAGSALTKSGNTLNVAVDDSSIEVSSDALRVKSGGITSAMLAGSIANSKLNQLTTANKVALSSLDLDGGTDIGADLVDADLIVVDDGAGGTNRKSALSRIKKYVYSAISGDATASDAGALTIASGAVETAMVNANVITGQTAETSIANDDLVLIYDTSESALRKMTKANFVSGLGSGSTAADDITAGDAAVTLATTSGNITIDAQATNSDIILKGTWDFGGGGTDTTFLTLDGSDGGTAIFNNDIKLQSDSSKLYFGADNDIYLEHVADSGLILAMPSSGANDPTFEIKSLGSDNSTGPNLKFNNSGSDANNDYLGFIRFYAPTSTTSTQYSIISSKIIDRTNSSYTSNLMHHVSSGGSLVEAIDIYGNSSDQNVVTKVNKFLDVADHNGTTGLKLGGTLVTSTAAELNIMDGGTSASSITVADADRLVINDDGTMKQIAVTTLAAYLDDEITAMPNLVTTAATTVGALNSGSISSGFGNIDNGTSNITTGGLLSIDVDSGSTINSSGGGIGAAGSITLGAGADAGLYVSSDNLYVENKTQDKDIIFRVNDGGTFTTIAHVDGADGRFQFAAGKLDIGGTAVTTTAAELNLLDGGTSVGSSITIADSDGFVINDNGTMKLIPASDLKTYTSSGGSTAADDLTAGDAAVTLTTTSGNITIDAQANDSDIIFKGTDGSADTTFLTLDGSDAGTAIFNNDIKLQSDSSQITFGANDEVQLVHDHNDGLILQMTTSTESLTDPAFTIKTTGTQSTGPIIDLRHEGSDSNQDETAKLQFSAQYSDNSTSFTGSIVSQMISRTASAKATRLKFKIMSNNAQAIPISMTGLSGSANYTTELGKYVDIIDHDGSTGLKLAGTLVTSTAAELNIMDGGTSATSTTLVDADRVVANDNGTMKQVAMSDVKTYIESNADLISGQTAETSIADSDLILIYDASESALRKMTKANFVSGLSGGGGGGFTYSAITSTTTAQASYHYSVNTSGGAVTLNLPARSGVTAGKEIRVKLATAGNDLTIDANGSETIDGSATLVLNVANQSVTLVAGSSTNWEII